MEHHACRKENGHSKSFQFGDLGVYSTNQKPAKMGMDVMKGMIIVECNGISNQYVSWTSLKLRCRPPSSWQFYFS